MGLIALIIADLLFLAALFSGERVHRNDLQTIGRDAAPSIIAAQSIKVAIADMDAEAANELLAKPGEGKAAAEAYQVRRIQAAEALISAAQNITYGDSERVPIKQLQLGLGEYEIKIQRARDFHERNDPQAIQAYRDASDLVKIKLFPAADDLDAANLSVLESTFASDASVARETRAGVTFTGLILLGLLLYIQWDLNIRVRRLLNPGLLVASIVALGLLSFGSGHLSNAADNLRIAKKNAFTSLHVLWQARALAYSANADESKYLLQKIDPDDQDSFYRKAAQIWGSSFSKSTNERGYLDEQQANITFEGEKEAVDKTLTWWQTYLKIDSQIRQLKSAGNVADAIELCLGKKEGQSDWAFQRFDEDLAKAIRINQDAFDSSITSGFAQLDNFRMTAAIAALAIGICCALGLFVRIREYM